MKKQTQFAALIVLITLILTIATSTVATAAQFEKSRLKADNSYLDASQETPTVVYENNVVYEHGQMTIRADKLTKQGEDAGTITAEGNPVKIHYIDEFGETTDIEAPSISYEQKSGELAADGDIQIIQTSAQDQLTLLGNKLRANQRITNGFSFVLTGNPTRFILKQPSQKEITAIADTLRSNGKDRKTQLVGSVKLSQGSSNTTAALLTYDGATKRISADQSSDGSQQVVTEFYWQDEPTNEQTETEKALEGTPQEDDIDDSSDSGSESVNQGDEQ
jgi:lipopolysaccharide export system protein LptA